MDLNWHILTERQFQRKGLPRWCSGKESACHCRRHKRHGFNPWVRKTPWSRKWWPTPVSLPRKFHGQRSLVGYGPRGLKELKMTEWLNRAAAQSKENKKVSVIQIERVWTRGNYKWNTENPSYRSHRANNITAT